MLPPDATDINQDCAIVGELSLMATAIVVTQGDLSKLGLEQIEHVNCNGKPLAYIIRGGFMPQQTTFVTPSDFRQQVGFIVYPKDGTIARHVHRSIKRTIVGTSEVLIVRQGSCEVDIYNDDRELVATRELVTGDIMLMVSGGHGFRMMEDTVFLE